MDFAERERVLLHLKVLDLQIQLRQVMPEPESIGGRFTKAVRFLLDGELIVSATLKLPVGFGLDAAVSARPPVQWHVLALDGATGEYREPGNVSFPEQQAAELFRQERGKALAAGLSRTLFP